MPSLLHNAEAMASLSAPLRAIRFMEGCRLSLALEVMLHAIRSARSFASGESGTLVRGESRLATLSSS